MTSARHSKQRRELNQKRTVAILNQMTFGLSQKCSDFQHDHGQLLLRSGLSTNVLNSERVLGTSMSDREYQLIKVKDSSEHHQIVNKWIDVAIKNKKLIIVNIDDYTNVHTKKRPLKGTSKASKMCTILLKMYDTEAVELISDRPANCPDGILLNDLVQNMSSNEQVQQLCFCSFVQSCKENAPWITNSFFDPLYEHNRLTTHDYAIDEGVKKMRKMDGTMLIDCIELPLHSEADFRKAIERIMETNMKRYCQHFILPQPGDWPAQFYPRRIVFSSQTNASVRSSLVPLLGPLHISLNGQENVFRVFYEVLRDIYKFVFGNSKTLAENSLPWRVSLILELTYGGWSLIRESIVNVFGEKCKDLQFLTMFNFLDNYLPLVLTIYAVIFRSNNFLLYVSALKRIWLMFFCFGRHHYDKSPLVFLSGLLYWDKISHPLLAALRTSLVAFTEYPVEYFHSIIRDQTAPHSTPDEITKTCRSIFASKQRQENFRETFLPPKNYVLSRNQLKSAKMKVAEMLKNIFANIIGKPNSSYATNSTVGEKREWLMPFIFGNKFKCDKVLPCGFHLSSKKDSEPDPFRECDFPNCQRRDDANWRVFKGCGHSFHVACVPEPICPICQVGIRRNVREKAEKAKQAIFAQSPTQQESKAHAKAAEDQGGKDDDGLPSLTEMELEEKSRQLNAEITSWPKYSAAHTTHPKDRQPTAPKFKEDYQTTGKKLPFNPMSGRRFTFQAENAIKEFVEKCHGEKPSHHQINHLLARDSRLVGETFERVKRKILTLLKSNKNKTAKVSPTVPSVPVPPWGGNFYYQGREIEMINTCPIDNLLTSFHLLFASDSEFLKTFTTLSFEGARTLLSVHRMFCEQQWSVGKLMWLTQVNLDVDLTRHNINVWGGEDERFFKSLREITAHVMDSTCTNPTCPTRNLRFSSKGLITLKYVYIFNKYF